MSSNVPTGRMRLVIVVLLLALLAFASFWVLEVLRRERGEVIGKLPAGEPDYTVEHFSIVRMSKTGHVHYALSGGELLHYPDRDVFEIQKPVVNNLDPKHPPMMMQAQRALVDRTSKKIHLYDHVLVTRPATAGNPAFRLTTSYLLFLPDDDIAETDKAVDIVFGRHHLSGTGMIANNRTREFRLLHNVHGLIETRPPAAR